MPYAQTHKKAQSSAVAIIAGMAVFAGMIALPSFAQLPSNALTGVTLEITPQYPEPNEEVTATLNSTAFDLNRSTISWRINGAEQLRGTGERTFSFTAGALGTRDTLTALVTSSQGAQTNASAIVAPASVDLLWQAQSYTPPFYKGKALHATGGMVQLTAIPHLVTQNGARLSPENLIYRWEDNGRVLSDLSGRGRDAIAVQASRRFTPRRFEVTVTSQDRAITAHTRIAIPISDPLILLYENHPTNGIVYNRALGNTVDLTEEETTVVAEPYFFSTDTRENENLAYEWRVEREQVNPDRAQQSILTLRQEGGSGAAAISVSVEHIEQLLQSAAALFNIRFEGDQDRQANQFE